MAASGNFAFNNPVFQEDQRRPGLTPPAAPTNYSAASHQAADLAASAQLEGMYAAPTASSANTGRMTVEDTVLKTVILFGILLVTAVVGWVWTLSPVSVENPVPTMMPWIIGALVIGGGIGLYAAKVVKMTQMPELVALMHSLVGLAACLVGFASYVDTSIQLQGAEKIIHEVEIYVGILIGAVTFSGSLIAFGKLNGRIGGKPLLLPGRHWLNLVALLVVIWNALILHARWGGMAKARGVAVLAVLGNIVATWSWFGTNQLGVGLHAYGFRNDIALWVVLSSAIFLGVAGLGALVPARLWRSFAPAAPVKGPKPRGGKRGTAEPVAS